MFRHKLVGQANKVINVLHLNIFNSLRSRIIVSVLLLTIIVLPGIGAALNKAFENQVRTNVENELNAYFYSILAITEMENGKLLMPEVVLENLFNVVDSGLYALITKPDAKLLEEASSEPQIIWSSNSFLGATLNQRLPFPSVGKSYFGQTLVNNEVHFIYSFSVRFESTRLDNTPLVSPIAVHIIKDQQSVLQQQKAFSQTLWTWLVVLMIALLVIQVFWLIWTLKPLAHFTQELNSVQAGEVEQLSHRYPNELNAVAQQLNGLLKNEQQQRRKYRNALSDLAHSLKTPLAVISSQKGLDASSTQQLKQIDRIITHQLKRAQGASSEAWHLGIKVQVVADKLMRTLAKIYPNIHISYARQSNEQINFYGDEDDLTEMLGNLLDNACKAANSQVNVSIVSKSNGFCISVEDDGHGVSASQQSLILERGKRADTYEQGHGIGLAIVRDLLDNYEGTLKIDKSSSLGGAMFSLYFLQHK